MPVSWQLSCQMIQLLIVYVANKHSVPTQRCLDSNTQNNQSIITTISTCKQTKTQQKNYAKAGKIWAKHSCDSDIATWNSFSSHMFDYSSSISNFKHTNLTPNLSFPRQTNMKNEHKENAANGPKLQCVQGNVYGYNKPKAVGKLLDSKCVSSFFFMHLEERDTNLNRTIINPMLDFNVNKRQPRNQETGTIDMQIKNEEIRKPISKMQIDCIPKIMDSQPLLYTF